MEIPLLKASHGDEEPDETQEEEENMAFYLILFALMMLFFITSAYNERYKPVCGHQTSYTIIAGIVSSCIIWLLYSEKFADKYQFEQDFFFNFLLPPIILNSGFNMRRRKFFQNIGNIAIFGLGVTFVCFFIYSVATYIVIHYADL